MSSSTMNAMAVAPVTRPTTTRKQWIDSARGLGILLVVIGHTLRGLGAAGLLPDTPIWGFIDRFIYAFHMPLFFVVAGLFLIPSERERYGEFARRRLLRLGYPYLLWGGLQTLSQVLLSRYTNHTAGPEAFLELGFEPPMQFWFLYALLLQTLFLGLLAKLGLGRASILALSLLIFISAPLLPIGHWSPLNQARNYLIYTALGVFFGSAERVDTVDRGLTSTYLPLVLLGYPAVGWAVYAPLISEQDRMLRVGVACLGILASVSLCVLLTRVRPSLASRARGLASTVQACSSLLVRWGEASLAIFVAHTLASAAVRIGLLNVLHVRNVALHLVLGTVVGIAVPWALYILSKWLAIPYLFEWPATPRVRETGLERSSRPSVESPA
jgi:fucose 4-O-acetylase-like acetyltransferase